MNYHLIINPSAGRGFAGRIQSKLFEHLQKEFEEIKIHVTKTAENAKEIATSLKLQADVILVAGGDGTIHEVVNGMLGGNVILGIIPMGTGNDFAKMLNLPLKYIDV